MFDDHSDVIRDIALEAGLVTPAQAEEIWESHATTGKSFSDSLVDAGLADRPTILQAIADHLQVQYYSAVPADPGEALTKLLKAPQAHKYVVVPVADEAGKLTLLAKDPLNSSVINELSFILQKDIELAVADPAQVEAAVTRIYGEATSSSMEDLLGEFGEVDTAAVTDEDVTKQASQAPIIRFVDLVLQEGVKAKASDIHFEPYETESRVRFRTDGILRVVAKAPIGLHPRIAARLKVMAALDIAERRVPQDGRIKLNLSKTKQMDFRVSTLPTLFGEKIVLRLLDNSAAKLGIEKLGYEPDQMQTYLEALAKPYGMILVTGPTGSGKTVSLYTGLNILNTPEVNISTAEDPVEIRVPGINQVQVSNKKGMTFAAALRSFLRQDPNIIMVGEIRDLETAEIAIKAAQTGHLVLSTLHTNDAPQTISRLMNMGIAPYNITSSVTLVIAQRLARRLHDCKRPMKTPLPPAALLKEGFTQEDIDEGITLYEPVGCDECTEGYKGRTGIYQVMPMTEKIQEIILAGGNALDIGRAAQESGVRDLRRSALMKAKAGLTSLAEINRVSKD